MTDPFAAYGKEAAARKAPLTGPITRRADARVRYGEIVIEISACGDPDMLLAYLATIGAEIRQFKAELQFLWEGDGIDFDGLDSVISRAFDNFRDYPESSINDLF